MGRVNAVLSRIVTERAKATAPRRPENQIRTWCLKGMGFVGAIRDDSEQIIKTWVLESRIAA